MTAFVSGFSAGSNLGNSIQDRRQREKERIEQAALAQDLRDWQKQTAERDFTYRKERDTVGDTRYGDETTYRRGRDAIGDTRYGDETAYRRGRDAIGDTRYGDETAYRRGRDAAGDTRADTTRNDQLEEARLARELRGREIEARIQAMQSPAKSGAYRQIRREDPMTGEVTTDRYPLTGEEPPEAPVSAARKPSAEDAEIEQAILGMQSQIGKHRVQQAQGDNRTGIFNLFSREGEIADLNKKIGNLQAMGGGDAPPAPAAAPQAGGHDPKAALDWARANPNDPRAKAILQRLGVR